MVLAYTNKLIRGLWCCVPGERARHWSALCDEAGKKFPPLHLRVAVADSDRYRFPAAEDGHAP
jgi:hypothetical protein